MFLIPDSWSLNCILFFVSIQAPPQCRSPGTLARTSPFHSHLISVSQKSLQFTQQTTQRLLSIWRAQLHQMRAIFTSTLKALLWYATLLISNSTTVKYTGPLCSWTQDLPLKVIRSSWLSEGGISTETETAQVRSDSNFQTPFRWTTSFTFK